MDLFGILARVSCTGLVPRTTRKKTGRDRKLRVFFSTATSLRHMPSCSRCNRYLRHSNFLAQKQEGTKEKESVRMNRSRRDAVSTQFLVSTFSPLHARRQPCRHSISALPSDCLARLYQVYGIPGSRGNTVQLIGTAVIL